MNKPDFNLSKKWDVIVIGTGMGGSTLGYSLAKKGFSVLFLEKGGDIAAGQEMTETASSELRLKQGWWPSPLSQTKSNGSYNQFHAAIGCGMGGSTIHYAAGLERLDATDFDTLPTQQKTLTSWPISYKEFLPFYENAEKLYGISNTAKTIDSNPKLSEWDLSFMQAMIHNGLKPLRLPVAIKYDQNCIECIGKVCHRRCKADAKVTCLDEALRLPNCHILTFCEVQSLDADQTSIKHVIATYQDKTLKLNAKLVVVAAGAMHSPVILLKSINAYWPNGLANSSDQVGRNLMFHGSDMYAIWSPKKLNRQSLQNKSLSIRDFWIKDGQRLGGIQSLGLSAGRGHISMFLKDILRKHGIRNEFLLSLITKIPSTIAARILGDASIFAALIEDDPLPQNRIMLDPNQPNGASFDYTISADMRERADGLYKAFSQSIKPWRSFRIMPAIDINNGHSCGTCKFGEDPATSVLDKNCRSHDVHNLYVVDASFMPRSGAANPSLTIAANALRVADKIAESLK